MRAILLFVAAILCAACSISFGPQQTPEAAYRLKIAEFKAQADAIQMRIIVGMVDHQQGNDTEKWAEMPAAIEDFRALLEDAARIEPPIIYQADHEGMILAIRSFDLAMERLTQFVETGREDRYNDFNNAMRSGNGLLNRVISAVPSPD